MSPSTEQPKGSRHPKYDENYVLPKTKYKVQVTAEKFVSSHSSFLFDITTIDQLSSQTNNNFLSRGRDAEELQGGKWWEKVEEVCHKKTQRAQVSEDKFDALITERVSKEPVGCKQQTEGACDFKTMEEAVGEDPFHLPQEGKPLK